MKKVGIEFLQRVNDGNYQHRELKITDVLEGETLEQIGALAHATTTFVQDVLDGKYKSTVIGTTTMGKAEVKQLEPLKEVKNGKGATVPKEDLKPVDAPKAGTNVEEPKDAPAAPADAPKDEPKKEKAKKETKAKPETTIVTDAKPSGKVEVYDRQNEKHKAQFGKFLDAARPGWDSDKTIRKYATASRAAHDKKLPFRDENGEILESFKTDFLALVVE